MIPSWRAVNEWFDFDCKMFSDKVTTRRVISEEFDGRNSGIVKVDVSFRVWKEKARCFKPGYKYYFTKSLSFLQSSSSVIVSQFSSVTNGI